MTASHQNENEEKLRQERREKRRAAKLSKMAQHGKKLATIYRDAALKRTREKPLKQE